MSESQWDASLAIALGFQIAFAIFSSYSNDGVESVTVRSGTTSTSSPFGHLYSGRLVYPPNAALTVPVSSSGLNGFSIKDVDLASVIQIELALGAALTSL